MAAGDGLRKSPLQQNLRDQGLGVDVDALAEQPEAGECENRGEGGGTGHRYLSSVIARSKATKQSSFLCRGDKAGLLRGACHRARVRATRWLAMTIRKNQRARPWAEAARAFKEEVGTNSSFHPASTHKHLTPVEQEQHQAEHEQDRAHDHLQFG